MMEQKPQSQGSGGVTALLFFVFGTAAGVLLAYSGIGFLQDGAALIATVFMAALFVVLLLGILVFALRHLIWRRLFGYAEVQIESFATPLAQVAERALAGDAPGATQAARDLVALVLARYAWISTRRWIITSLTGLIAAMAALAGTALLFKQNQLIEVQSGLLEQQNARIADQTLLLQQDVELAEAARNAGLAVQITEIGEALGALADALDKDQFQGGLFARDVPRDLPNSLVLRITALSRAVKPYRYLDLGLRPGDLTETTRLAMQRRRADLPETYAAMAAQYGWRDTDGAVRLIDRPQSPERGQLLMTMMLGGVRNLESLVLSGLDLSHAALTDATIVAVTAQTGLLTGADLSGSSLTAVDLRGARMENIRLRRTVLDRCLLGRLDGADLRPEMPEALAGTASSLVGADLEQAVIRDSSLAGASMLAANLDGALLLGADLSGASLGAATLRGTVVLNADFSGAFLKRSDWDGAVLFGADALQRLQAADPTGGFVASEWRLEPMTRAEVMDIPLVNLQLTEEQVAAAGEAFRVARVQPLP